jgi:hypothetical protein
MGKFFSPLQGLEMVEGEKERNGNTMKMNYSEYEAWEASE